MACISAPLALAGSSLLSAGGSVISGITGADAAQSAAQAQAAAAQQAAQLQYQMYGETAGRLKPFVTAGSNATGSLQGLTGTTSGGNPLTAALTSKFTPTMESLAATPGYQFTLQQGLQATQNGFAAQGLGASGAALKGAANYAEGLAGTTYQQQFANNLTQNQQIYNMLAGQSSLGENAAAMTGNAGAQATTGATNALLGGAAATAAGIVGGTNAMNSGITGALSGIGSGASLYSLMGGSGSGGLNSTGGLFGSGDVSVADAGAFGLANGLQRFSDGSIG